MTDNVNMNNSNNSKSISMWWVWLLVLAIILCDQYTKGLFSRLLDPGVPFTVFTGFDLLLAHNDGAAFSFLQGAGGWQRWILTGISTLVSLLLTVWLWRLPRQQTLLTIAIAFILGGALGNLYDRAVMGYVVDFISVYAGQWRFATFNVADAAISCGSALLVVDMLRSVVRHD